MENGRTGNQTERIEGAAFNARALPYWALFAIARHIGSNFYSHYCVNYQRVNACELKECRNECRYCPDYAKKSNRNEEESKP